MGTDRAPLGGTPWQGTLLTVRFLTELALLAVLAVVMVRIHGLLLGVRIGLAVLAVVATATIWGLWIAPKARRRLPDPWRLILEIVLFGLATAGLVVQHDLIAAVVFAVATIGVASLMRKIAPGG
ncbi:MAG TPA: YrdB family protein [Streptosporangiaceae bacterium]|nr:YrdB family protein [Streptosporangiaceae bacterium]